MSDEVVGAQWRCESVEPAFVSTAIRPHDEKAANRSPKVLLIGHSHDPDVRQVLRRLTDFGAEADAVFVDEIGNLPTGFVGSTDALDYDIGYCRAFRPGDWVNYHFDRTIRRSSDWRHVGADIEEYATSQAKTVLWHWLSRVTVATWVNSPWQLRMAENKLVQLDHAVDAGLLVPRTMVTNRGCDVRELLKVCGDGIVRKSLNTPIVACDGESATFQYTHLVSDEDIRDLAYPAMFQQRLRSVSEYRVTMVGQRVFVAVLHRDNDCDVDWRRDADDHQRFVHGELPDQVITSLRRLMASLGLEIGAVDLVQTETGFYFLELNPSAALMWLERSLGMRLCQTVTEHLICSA